MWIRIKHSYNSDQMDYVGNHTMGVICDGDTNEKIIIFGGIQNHVEAPLAPQSDSESTSGEKT